MNICRTCLKTPANKDILQLENAINKDTMNYVDIMVFCLDITVTKDSKITKKLCNNCYRKIISFYEFKTLSLKNDVYLKSLQPEITLDDTKISVYVDENGIKHENTLDPDECGPSIVEDCNTNIKSEYNIEYETTEAIESDIDLQSVEEFKKCEETEGDIKENATKSSIHKKRDHSKKGTLSKTVEVEQQRVLEENSVCEECGIYVLNLKLHSEVHRPRSDRKMVRCKLCPKLFTTKGNLTKHHKTKHLGVKLECDICYKKVWNMSSHKRHMHNPDALRFGCVQCDRRCESQSALNAHMISHTKVLPYECDHCLKKFCNKYQIASHILRVHTKVKEHQCHVCSKAYFTKFNLVEHLRTHTNERPYKCGNCDKSFAKKDSLRKHRRTHSDKTFKCQVCDKSFVTPNHLNGHMICHTKEQKYPCQFCGARFSRAGHRKRHERNVHQKHAS